MTAFVDTNVVVYRFDHDVPAKRDAAQALFESAAAQTLVVSTQVLQETFNALTRRLATSLSAEQAAVAVAELSELTVIPSDESLVLGAIRTTIDHQVSIWDALIVEAAVRGGCDVLFSEDLNAGQRIKGVEIVNPFA